MKKLVNRVDDVLSEAFAVTESGPPELFADFPKQLFVKK